MCSWKMKWRGGRDVARSGRETKWGSSWRSPKWALNVAYRLTGQSFKEWTNCAQNGGISCLGPVELPLPFTSLVAALVKRALNMSTNWAIGHMCSIEGEGRESVRGPFHLHSRFFAYDPYSLCCLPNPSRTHGPVRGCRKQTVVPQHG